MKTAVVLLSGGMDSATALYLAGSEGYRCLSLVVDYGQRHDREIDSAERVARAAGSGLCTVRLGFPWKGSALLDDRIGIPARRSRKIPVTYVPARNTIFLALALSYAESKGASAVFIGAHSEDYSGYPDCRAEYFRAFSKVKDLGTRNGGKIRILAPLVRKNKAEIIRLGQRLGVPFGLTWSCYKGGKRPCGKCDSCYYRAKGFREAGVIDPLIPSA